MTRRVPALPLYGSEPDIAVLVLGPEKAAQWPNVAPVLEREGLPKIDPLMGGRYVPAVKAFFNRRCGVSGGNGPLQVDGEETWS